MEQQQARAQATRTHLKTRTVGGEGIFSHRPWAQGAVSRNFDKDITLTIGAARAILFISVIEDDFEHAACFFCRRPPSPHRLSISVKDPFGVAIRGSHPISLVRPRQIDAAIILSDIFIENGIAFAIETGRNQPAENMLPVGWVANAGIARVSIESENVILRKRTPMDVAIL